MKLHNSMFYLIGVPAVGKYTIAKELGRMTGAKVVDNQLINLPVFSVVGYDGTSSFPFPQGAWKQIEKLGRRSSQMPYTRCHIDEGTAGEIASNG